MKELVKLHVPGPMTLTELAVGRIRSAIDQRVAATRSGGDCAAARRGVARTEYCGTDLEAEIVYPLTAVVRDIEAVLRWRSFHDRIRDRLAGDPAWKD